jgi:tRNA-specific 2-thiouridylase
MNDIKKRESQVLTVAVGMSGGVDSSVAALLLKQQGYNVIGLYMKNWEETDDNGVCRSAKEYDDVALVADAIGIPCYTVNFTKEYRRDVFAHFLQELAEGHTPNPDILCNKEIKFKQLLQKALELGADYLATGHYARVGQDLHGPQLLKGADASKDQSYFLYAMPPAALKQVLFPLGHLLKKDVRTIARAHGLATADKDESMGICFIGERNFKPFVGQYIQYRKGNLETLSGQVVGQHDGTAFYTIGQRKGLGIGGKGDAWFVVDKSVERNAVIVAQGANHPALFSDALEAQELSWISHREQQTFPWRVRAKIRYRQPDQECLIEKIEEGTAYVSFCEPQRAITLRQSIVFYDGDICLGGGMISKASPSYYAQNKPLPNDVALSP